MGQVGALQRSKMSMKNSRASDRRGDLFVLVFLD